jgi:hypothetical protein
MATGIMHLTTTREQAIRGVFAIKRNDVKRIVARKPGKKESKKG